MFTFHSYHNTLSKPTNTYDFLTQNHEHKSGFKLQRELFGLWTLGDARVILENEHGYAYLLKNE